MKRIQQILCYCLVVLGSCLGAPLSAQITDSTVRQYPAINEDLLIHTRWKYTYTTHAQSNTVIHRADETYDHFVFFRYDYFFLMYLNGTHSTGQWHLNREQNEIRCPFRQVEWWRLAHFDEQTLILEFTMNRKSAYRYHFIRVRAEETPFSALPNDLPDVEVDLSTPEVTSSQLAYEDYLQQRGIRYNAKRWERRQARFKRRDERRQARLQRTARGRAILEREAPKELLQIELMGGGFFGGVDPVYRNMVLIKSDGEVIKEYHSALQGLQVSKHTVDRAVLEELIEYIEERDFFDFDQTYLCESPACQRRLQNKPRPIAFRIAVTKGVRRHIITIPIWDGRGLQHSLIPYPQELDEIVRAIMNVATTPVE